jgi:hypothetical protein
MSNGTSPNPPAPSNLPHRNRAYSQALAQILRFSFSRSVGMRRFARRLPSETSEPQMEDLGTARNVPVAPRTAINKSGQITGFPCDPASNTCLASISQIHPCIWLCEGINDAGEIVRQGRHDRWWNARVPGHADTKKSE